MRVLFWGSSSFCLAFLLHLIMWKIHLPRRQTKTILQIFFGVLIVCLLILWLAPLFIDNINTFISLTLPEYLLIVLFFVSLTLAYVITYSAIEADSPSLVMVMTVANAGPQGLNKEEFNRIMTDDILVMPRVRDLLRDKMVYMDGDKYRLTLKGFLFAYLFIHYRNLLNAPEGG